MAINVYLVLVIPHVPDIVFVSLVIAEYAHFCTMEKSWGRCKYNSALTILMDQAILEQHVHIWILSRVFHDVAINVSGSLLFSKFVLSSTGCISKPRG